MTLWSFGSFVVSAVGCFLFEITLKTAVLCTSRHSYVSKLQYFARTPHKSENSAKIYAEDQYL